MTPITPKSDFPCHYVLLLSLARILYRIPAGQSMTLVIIYLPKTGLLTYDSLPIINFNSMTNYPQNLEAPSPPL